MTLPRFGEMDGNKEEKKVQTYILACLPKTFSSQVQVKLAILSLTISAIFFNSQNRGEDSLVILRGKMATSLEKCSQHCSQMCIQNSDADEP